MILKSAIHWQGLVKAISKYRFKKQFLRGRSREYSGSSCPETLYHAASHGRSSTQAVLPEKKISSGPPETAVPVLKLYY